MYLHSVGKVYEEEVEKRGNINRRFLWLLRYYLKGQMNSPPFVIKQKQTEAEILGLGFLRMETNVLIVNQNFKKSKLKLKNCATLVAHYPALSICDYLKTFVLFLTKKQIMMINDMEGWLSHRDIDKIS